MTVSSIHARGVLLFVSVRLSPPLSRKRWAILWLLYSKNLLRFRCASKSFSQIRHLFVFIGPWALHNISSLSLPVAYSDKTLEMAENCPLTLASCDTSIIALSFSFISCIRAPIRFSHIIRDTERGIKFSCSMHDLLKYSLV